MFSLIKIKYSVIPIFVFAVIFVIYLMTMMPSQAFHDSGEYQTVIYTTQIAHPTGFPTYILLGKFFSVFMPFAEIAWIANFLSVIYSVGALIFVYLITSKLSGSSLISLLSAIVLAFVQPFWYYAGVADAHTLNRLFTFTLIYIFILLSNDWNLRLWLLFCFLAGLGLGNHLLLIYALSGVGMGLLWIWLSGSVKFRLKDVTFSLILFICGLSVYLLLPVRGYEGAEINSTYSLRTVEGFYRHVFGGNFQGLMFQGGLNNILDNMRQGVLQLRQFVLLPGIILGGFGILYGFTRNVVVMSSLTLSFIALLAFSTNYPTSDPNRYYMSYVGIFCICIGLGAALIEHSIYNLLAKELKLIKIITFLLFCLFLILPLQLYLQNFELSDKSKNIDAKLYSDKIFRSLPEDSVIVTWWNYYTPLWYRQSVLGERPDILILNNNSWRESIDKYINLKPVYVVELRDELNSNYVLEYQDPLYKVQKKEIDDY